MAGFGSRLKHAFNTFFAEEKKPTSFQYNLGPSYSTRPDRTRFRMNSERTIISSIYTRISIDVSGVRIEHVRTDENNQYIETINSGLNDCLNVEANIDQAGRHFRTDIARSMFDWGSVAIIPVDTTLDPRNSGNYDVRSLRVGEILQWYPQHVQVEAYNEKKGIREKLVLPKSMVAIVENPFYSVMNEPNSTLQRLIHKLNLLDNVDEISSKGKLDIIIQLPYVIKSQERKNQAELRRSQIEEQLSGSSYGIAYTDGTEKITQLNRAVENNLLDQVKYLKEELYDELGLTKSVMNGTASDVEMMNYFDRTIEPIMDAITEAIARTFLTKTARTQGQTIMYFQSPFKLLPISDLANVVDVLSRNQIVTPNEIRPTLGLKPSQEPQASQLINSNMPLSDQVTSANAQPTPDQTPPVEAQLTPQDQASLDAANAAEARLNQSMAELGL